MGRRKVTEEEVDWAKMEASAGGEDLPVVLSDEMLRKRIMWDVTPCDLAEAVRERMGLAGASEDVEEMEHAESHQRLVAMAAILPAIVTLSSYATEAAVTSIIMDSHPDAPEQIRRDVVESTELMIRAATMGVIAELLDIGLLHTTHLPIFHTPPGFQP
jgi:hypothetical protein